MNKLAMAVVAVCAARAAYAEDFDGKWKVPDSIEMNPAACSGGDVKECLRLAWVAEAGIQSPGDTFEKRLEEAARWHGKACAIAKQKACANADRVKAKVVAYRSLKTDGERQNLACVDALEGAKRFAEGSVTAPVVVVRACGVLFTAPGFQRTLRAMGGFSKASKPVFVLQSAVEGLCPTLKAKPPACANRRVEKIAETERTTALASIFRAALTGDAAAHADELAEWFLR